MTKCHLLLAVAMCLFTTIMAQNKLARVRVAGIENAQLRFNRSLQIRESEIGKNVSVLSDLQEDAKGVSFSEMATSPSSLVTSWKPFTGSMNIYGLKYSNTKPLQYNDELGMVSFFHTKSSTYSASPVGSPGSLSGVVVAMLSIDAGLNWDSICVWNNDTSWARSPQGGIYNPPLNTFGYSSAHLVTTGFTLRDDGTKSGNFFATKKLCLENFNNVAGTYPGTQKFISHSAPYTELEKTDLASFEFTSTDDGLVRAMGLIVNDINASTFQDFGYRGVRVLKGTFTSGIMQWTGDSIIPDVTVTNGVSNVLHVPYMAWNESGSVGYVFHIGCLAGAGGANVGYQPIIYKTTNSGLSWNQIPGIDFNLPSMDTVKDHILCTLTNTALSIPFFNAAEGISATVDHNNRLHIVSTLRSTSSSHPDSLGYTLQFLNPDGETYSFPHIGGYRPYIYDFIGDGIGQWTATLVDSMSSEKPGENPGENGYTENPWRHTNNQVTEKVSSGARIQLSRTPDGKHIVYTWAESDTLLTTNSFKWNVLPNIKARIMDVMAQSVHSLEINISNPGSYPYATSSNALVGHRAYFHTVSPKCIKAQTTMASNWPAIVLPVTVSRNSLFFQDQPVFHRYAAAVLNFENVSVGNPVSLSFQWQQPDQTTFRYCATGVPSYGSAVNKLVVYPNPATNKIYLTSPAMDLSNTGLWVFSTDGRLICSREAFQLTDGNTLTLDTRNFQPGMYFVKIVSEQLNTTARITVDR